VATTEPADDGDPAARQYHRATMEPGRVPVTRRLAAGLGSALASVTNAPSHAIRRTPLGERDRGIAARRLEALQALATELAGALTTAQITDLLMSRGIAALRADGSAVFLIDPGQAGLTAIGWRGHSDARARTMGHLSLDVPLPATDVARTGEPVFIEDPHAFVDRYGPTFRKMGVAPELRAVAAVPLEVDGHRFGVLAFNWNHPHPIAPDRQAFIAAIARLGASAMERGRLFDAERAALHRAEDAQRRLDLLSEAARVLGMSLDYEEILGRLAGLALPMLGDVCIVDVLAGDGARRHVGTADPALGDATDLIESGVSDLVGETPVSRVVREGTSGSFGVDSGTVAADRFGMRWGLGVPIRVLDRTTGAIVFLRRADRPYDAEDVAVAEELGDRAGRALDNARLHGEVARLADHEQRHAAELEAAIGALGEGILVTDPDGSIRIANDAALRLLGGPASTIEEILDRLIDSDDRRPTTLDRGPAEYRLIGRSTAWIEVTSYPVAQAAGVLSPPTVVVCRDVTAFRQGQALREAFLGLLSHELRTPVTTIYGGAAVLAKPGKALDPAMAGEILADIASESDRLYRLVEDLLVLARFDEGFELGEEPALLQHLVPAVVDQERGRWPLVNFDVHVAPNLPAVSGDETSITQILRNLLSNAAKYSGGSAVVTAVVEPDPDGVAVRVRDQGPGIDPLEAEAIFDPFFRSPSTAKMAGGAGIGLYVSRRLVGAMNGRIWAAPRPGGGSEFSFVLPTYRADEDD
jgi:signal transduction histidine kinase